MNANRSQTSALVGVLFSLLTASQALQAGAAAPCAVGLELKPGESCDLSDGETFSIRDDGCVGEQPAVAVRQGGFSLLVGSRSRYTTWNKGPDGEKRNVKTVTCISGYIEIDGFRASEIRETCGDILPRPDCSWQIDRLPYKDAVEARLTEELFASIKDGYVDGVRQALEAGAKADATRRAGASALLAAMGPGNTEIVQLLIEAGADVNYVLPSQPYGSGAATGMSALLAAVGQGNAEIVQLLIEAGADVNYAPTYNYGVARGASDPAEARKTAPVRRRNARRS